MRNYSDAVGNRTRDLPPCRVVPQAYATTYPDVFKTNLVESPLLPRLLALPYETEHNKIAGGLVFLCHVCRWRFICKDSCSVSVVWRIPVRRRLCSKIGCV